MRDSAFENLRLDPAFNIRGNENIVPLHRSCNNLKADLLLSPSLTALYLGKIKEKQVVLQANIASAKKYKKRDQIYAEIKRHIDAEILTPDDLKRLLSEMSIAPISAAPLPHSPQLATVKYISGYLKIKLAPTCAIDLVEIFQKNIRFADQFLRALDTFATSARVYDLEKGLYFLNIPATRIRVFAIRKKLDLVVTGITYA